MASIKRHILEHHPPSQNENKYRCSKQKEDMICIVSHKSQELSALNIDHIQKKCENKNCKNHNRNLFCQ